MTTQAATHAPPSKALHITAWVLQILAALMFFASGGMKLGGAAMPVELFEKIGFGQWFRLLTGALEVLGAVLLLVPRLAGAGALLLAAVMLGAIYTHLFTSIGGSPGPAIFLLLVTGFVAWARRDSTKALLGRA